MTNLTFQITPDSNKDSETIQIGRDLKLSCHVDATPQDKVNYSWYKNGVPVFGSKSIIILRSDPELAPGTSSLEIVDMNFRDLATYSCVANFPGSRVPELRVDVNISQNGGEFLPRHVRHHSKVHQQNENSRLRELMSGHKCDVPAIAASGRKCTRADVLVTQLLCIVGGS